MLLLILVAGMPGAGKSIVVDVAKEEYGIPVYTMGDVVREETMKRYGVITPETMLKTSRELRKEYGPQYIAVKTFERLPHDQRIVLIDGVRSLDEVEYFRSKGEAVIVAIHASPKTRFKRLLERGRPGDPSSWDDFVKRDKIELSFGIGNVIALADYMVVNEGSLEEAREQIRRVLKEIIGVKRK